MGKAKGRISSQMKGSRMIPIVPREYLPFEKLPVGERVAAIKKAKSLLNAAAPKDLQLGDIFMSKKNWRCVLEDAGIIKKSAHNVKKSHKTERKGSR